MTDVTTVCPYCGTGCGMRLSRKDNQIVEINGDPTNPVKEGDLCLKGLYGFKHVASPARLATPLMKHDGKFVSVSWDTALDAISKKVAAIKEESGPDALAVFASARATNEENYIAQKCRRAAESGK
jgi:predicted molibdopterin-dependent oxidoreductase YjgC